MNKELQKLLLVQQEEQTYHLPMEAEYSFYRRIANGDMELLKLNMNADTMEGTGKLSSSPLQNKKYHLVILTAMITRFCIEAGLDPEQAYTLSDMHIRKIDACLTPEQLDPRKGAVVKDFVLAMHELHNSPGLSYHVRQAVSYINSHITEPIKVSDVADAIKLHPDYLTRLFKKDMNCSLSQYMIKEKCRTARYMLLNSQASCTEISSFLYFASCSHFVNCFKKEYGLTPNAYRKQMGGLSNDGSNML